MTIKIDQRQPRGYFIETVANGQESVKAFDAYVVDGVLIFLDRDGRNIISFSPYNWQSYGPEE